MISSTFSIDYIAGKDKSCGSVRHQRSESEDSLRRSPVLTSRSSPSGSESDNPESIVNVLLTLDKSMKANMEDTATYEKPPQSYIALISMAILSSPSKRMLLCDIYQYIMDNFRFYNNANKAWRNSIRHNLSLNECFVKNGRSENGKGNYWSIHPACIEDFSHGDFRRRQARRRAKKSMKEVDVVMTNIKGRMKRMIYVPMTASPVGYHNEPPYSFTRHELADGCGTGAPPLTSAPSSFYQSTSPEMHRHIPHPSLLQNLTSW
ncbi:forkhead box protein I3-like [Ylistrum balloti]|uniref:forkhead box protein I3-like n=1 Tax=Ylistrum balloti TaxID=509963 RepID=UPI002905F073|nr:forkhead box protein I3-like [Ylistrum balloti]